MAKFPTVIHEPEKIPTGKRKGRMEKVQFLEELFSVYEMPDVSYEDATSTEACLS